MSPVDRMVYLGAVFIIQQTVIIGLNAIKCVECVNVEFSEDTSEAIKKTFASFSNPDCATSKVTASNSVPCGSGDLCGSFDGDISGKFQYLGSFDAKVTLRTCFDAGLIFRNWLFALVVAMGVVIIVLIITIWYFGCAKMKIYHLQLKAPSVFPPVYHSRDYHSTRIFENGGNGVNGVNGHVIQHYNNSHLPGYQQLLDD
jgi:hypothetical protein